MGDEADGLVGAGGAHDGLLFFFGDVDVHVLFAVIFTENHAFVDVDGGTDEELAAFLDIPQSKRGGDSGAVGDERARGAQGHFAGVVHPAIEDGVNEGGAARVREQLAAQADQAARGDFEIQAHAAGIVVAHLEHFAAAAADGFQDDADETFRDVDHQALEGLELAAVFGAHNDFGFADHQFKTFAAHGLDQDGELQFAAAEHAEGFRRVGVFDADGDVGEQLFLQAVAKVARSNVGAFLAGKRAAVDGENHGQRGLVDQERFERLRGGEVGDALADLDAFDAGDGHEVASENAFGFVAFESAKCIEFGDARGFELARHGGRAAELADADVGAALDGAVEDAADGDAAEKIAVIEIHHLDLQDAFGIAGRRGDGLDDGLEERKEILGVIADFAVGDAIAGVGVDDGKIELVFGGVEIDEQVVDFVEDFRGAGVGAIDFVQHDDRRKLGGQGFLQDVARLRQRAFAGVDEKDHAVDHAQGALDFTAEIAVAGSVDDIDFGVVEKERGVFGEDGDAALALEVVGIHDALDEGFVGAEDAGLTEHGVDEGGFAVVDVGDDGDVANILGHGGAYVTSTCDPAELGRSSAAPLQDGRRRQKYLLVQPAART